MATRGRIGILNADGSVDSIYSHWDNYPEHNGKILVESYTDEHKVRELISMGSLSILGNEIGEKHPFDNPCRYGTQEYHEHENKYSGMCTFYGRDRNERGVSSTLHHSVEAYAESSSDSDAEYLYLYVNGVWLVNDVDQITDDWGRVKDMLAMQDTAE